MTDAVLDRIARALDDAGRFDSNVMKPPVALLWPDKARQWESAIEEVRGCRPVVTLGVHDPERGHGPAYWVRCVVAGTVDADLPDGLPVIYMPGVSHDDFRALGFSDQQLAPLAALQYRSQWFAQPNGKDWTVRAFFVNKERGLGLNVAGDDATVSALLGSLVRLIKEPMTRLEGRHVDAGFLNALVNPDPIRLLLRWIDDPGSVRHELGDAAWGAFVQQCKSDFGFDPAIDGVFDGAKHLGVAEGRWKQVWLRFRESPADYPDIPSRLREAQPAELILPNPGAWPAPAGEAEDALRAALVALRDVPVGEARSRVLKLEEEHKARRGHVWADLGWSPLALALEHITEVARRTVAFPPPRSVEAIADWYATTGWMVDRSVLRALNEVDRRADIEAVTSVFTAIYRPWLEHASKSLQAAVGPEANAGTYQATPNLSPANGGVIVFIDGLRLDVAHLLAERLEGGAAGVEVQTALAALPTVTQTAKPVLAPINQALLGPGAGLDACRAPGGATASVKVLRSLLTEADIEVLGAQDLGDPSGRAWTETGEIDHKGHDLGTRLAHEIDDQVQRIARRIRDLLDAGWTRVTVVTDHGWLLLPSGLPKNKALPVAATVAKKGRCARLKDGATVDVPTIPWHWDKDVRIAVAPGISCFEANQTYEHGGVSPQECIVPRLVVTTTSTPVPTTAEITSIKWRGLTLVVEFSDLPEGATVDLRRRAGDPNSSIADLARVTGGTGKVILLVEDEDLEGYRAQLVVIANDGTLILQRETMVAQNR